MKKQSLSKNYTYTSGATTKRSNNRVSKLHQSHVVGTAAQRAAAGMQGNSFSLATSQSSHSLINGYQTQYVATGGNNRVRPVAGSSYLAPHVKGHLNGSNGNIRNKCNASPMHTFGKQGINTPNKHRMVAQQQSGATLDHRSTAMNSAGMPSPTLVFK